MDSTSPHFNYLNFSESYFRKVNLSGSSYNDHCYLKTQFKKLEDDDMDCPGDEIDGYCSLLSDKTDWIYSTGHSITACLFLTPLSVAGFILNFLVILAVVKTPSLRKEYLSSFIISLAVTDLIMSTFTLPILVAKYAMR